MNEEINKKIKLILPNEPLDIELPIYVSRNTKYFDTLVLSGGGIRGIAYIGSLKALDELKLLEHIHTYAGTSIGSLVCFLCVIGYTIEELINYVKIIEWNKLLSINILNTLETFGFDNGEKIVSLLKKFLMIKHFDSNITLKQLYEKTNKTLIITSVNVNQKIPVYFSHQTYPDMQVVQCIRMSISIPFIFTPVNYNNELYVDGGCIDNFPIKQFQNSNNRVLGLYLESKEKHENIKTIDTYVLSVIECCMSCMTNTECNQVNGKIINIETNSFNAINFNLNPEQRQKLFSLGYEQVMQKFNS